MEAAQNTDSFIYITLAFKKVKRYWYVFVISMIICVTAALFANWYAQPNYKVSSVILIEDNPNSNKTDASEEFKRSFNIFKPESDIEREILKMQSSELIYKALRKINSELSFYVKEGIRTREYYTEFPFKISIDKRHLQPIGIEFCIIPKSDKQYSLRVEKNDGPVQLYNYEKGKVERITSSFGINQTYNYGDTVKGEFGSFCITLQKEKLDDFRPDAQFLFSFNDITALTYIYQKSLSIDQVAKGMQAASISIQLPNAQKGIDLINALMEAYLQRNTEKRNSVAEKTIDYLNKQLSHIEDSLQQTESNLEQFRSSHRVMGIENQAQETFRGTRDLENQKADLEAKSKYYTYISNKLESDKNGSDILTPAAMGVNDNVLNGIIEEYVKLNTERNNLIQSKQSQSPYFNSLTIRISNLKNTLSENLKNQISATNLLLANVTERLRKENANLSMLPGTERELVGIERKQKVNDDLYSYILKKKSEAEVAKMSNLANNDILEPAKLAQLKPVSPNKMANLAIALFASIIIPFVGFFMMGYLDKTILDEQMMYSLTTLPFIGRIYHKKGKKEKISILLEDPRSPLAESFRVVRTNLEYFLKEKRNQVILTTSTLSGEGKSFTSLNMAVGLSLLNRKVLLLDFDMRKPTLYHNFKMENVKGVSTYLAGKNTLDEIIVSTGVDYFDFISAGPVPINPTELIGSEKTEILINELRERYDYVIIDTPPIGLVTEAILLMKYADLKIMIVREKVTPKNELVKLLKELENKKVTDLYWLINDVDIRDTFYGEKNGYFKSK